MLSLQANCRDEIYLVRMEEHLRNQLHQDPLILGHKAY